MRVLLNTKPLILSNKTGVGYYVFNIYRELLHVGIDVVPTLDASSQTLVGSLSKVSSRLRSLFGKTYPSFVKHIGDALIGHLSKTLLAALRVAGQGTTNAGELRARLLAGWVAEDRLAEHRARAVWLPVGIQRGTTREGGLEFAWQEEVISTPNPAFRRVNLRVFLAGDESHTLANLIGFVVNAPPAVR